MIILGIETSCDETAASVVKDGEELLSNVVISSMDLHVAYGGVVPEIAARSHIESIIQVVDSAVSVVGWDKIDGIAVTYGAGLGTSLLVGVMTARTLAIAKNKPLYAVNHVEGHVYANFISKTSLPNYQLPTTSPQFPILAVIVSGKHTQLVIFNNHFDYIVLGKTRDDAIGEAFDKVAKIVGLPYPGGPSVSKEAEKGDSLKYKLPKARLDEKYDFSYSGLKTAVLRLAQQEIGEDFTFPSFKLSSRLSEVQKADISASFQRIAVETVVDKAVLAFEEYNPKCVIIAGGAAANKELRRQLKEALSKVEGRRSKVEETPNTKYQPPTPAFDIENVLHFTDQKLCTDNGAMIATLGCFMAMNNQPTANPYSLDIEPSLKM